MDHRRRDQLISKIAGYKAQLDMEETDIEKLLKRVADESMFFEIGGKQLSVLTRQQNGELQTLQIPIDILTFKEAQDRPGLDLALLYIYRHRG